MTEVMKAPWHLWVIGLLLTLWNGVGAYSYLMTRMGKLADLGMTPDQIAYFDSYPVWANSFWALGVWGAFIGALLLLLRFRWAVPAAIISVIGLLGTSVYQHMLTTTPESLQNTGLTIAIWVSTLFQLWYSYRMRGEGVLR